MEVELSFNEWCKKRVVEEMIENMNINTPYNDDLVQEIYLILLEYDRDKINQMIKNKQINFFISRVIMNQVFSCTSDFYKKYVKWDINKVEYNFDIDSDEYEESYGYLKSLNIKYIDKFKYIKQRK